MTSHRLPLLAIIAFTLLLNSCGHFFVKEKSYNNAGSSVEINGAIVNSNVKPMGGSQGLSISAMVYMIGKGTTDGPFIWRIEAEGQEGVQESLTVHRIKVATQLTKRSEWYPAQHLNKPAPFKALRKEPGKTFAQYQIPGKLEVYPEKDGDISVMADISIKSNARTVRKTVRFNLPQKTSKRVETINMGAEIISSFRDNPKEWDW